MRYNTISNDVLMRRRVTPSDVVMGNVFDHQEIEQIEQFCAGDMIDAKVAHDRLELEKLVRESKIKFIRRDFENSWVFNKFNQLVYNINEEFYGFDLYGYDALQYTVYDGESNGHYDWHSDLLYGMDLGETLYNSITRKLTMVALLNEPGVDFTGGEFQINVGRESEASTINLQKGSVAIFPSFVLHRVKPVLSGVRKSLVIWVEGPKFR